MGNSQVMSIFMLNKFPNGRKKNNHRKIDDNVARKKDFFSGTLSIVLLTYCLIPYFINIIAGVCPSKDPPATLSGSKFSQKTSGN